MSKVCTVQAPHIKGDMNGKMNSESLLGGNKEQFKL